MIYLRKGKRKQNMEILEKILAKGNLNKAYKKVYHNNNNNRKDNKRRRCSVIHKKYLSAGVMEMG